MVDKNKEQWTRQPGVHQIERKGKIYKNLVMFTRACVTCGASFGIYVSQAVANGEASNNNFSLKNCEQHRLRAVAPGAAGELERLREYERTAAEELASNYKRIRELFEEVQVLKARLATYELQGAMEQHTKKNGESLTFPWS